MQDKRELTQDLQMMVHLRTAGKKALETALNCMKAEDVIYDRLVLRNMNGRRKSDKPRNENSV